MQTVGAEATLKPCKVGEGDSALIWLMLTNEWEGRIYNYIYVYI